MPDLDGKSVALTDYKGKVVIVDIWGTWCPPCRMEIPHFVELHKKYRDAGLEIIGLNYEGDDADEARDTVNKFVTEHGVTYKCLLGDAVTQSQVPEFGGFPTTLFIDRTGRVRLKEVGYRPLSKHEAIVSSLLEESRTSSDN